MTDIKIYENLIPHEAQDNLERLCLSGNFGWHFHPSSAYTDEQAKLLPEAYFNNVINTPFFSHIIIEKNLGVNSRFISDFEPLLEKIPNITNYTITRFKINLTTPYFGCSNITHSYPHVDIDAYSQGDLTAIYYVNDSDGDTILFNEKMFNLGPLSVCQKITPKKGKLILFNANRLHAGNNPISNYTRVVANINLSLRNVNY